MMQLISLLTHTAVKSWWIYRIERAIIETMASKWKNYWAIYVWIVQHLISWSISAVPKLNSWVCWIIVHISKEFYWHILYQLWLCVQYYKWTDVHRMHRIKLINIRCANVLVRLSKYITLHWTVIKTSLWPHTQC